MPQTRALRLLTAVAIGLIAMLLIACEEVVGTATPSDEMRPDEVEATAQARETATSSANATATSDVRSTSQIPPLSRTAVAGGSPVSGRPTAEATSSSTGTRPTPSTVPAATTTRTSSGSSSGRELTAYVPDLSPFVGGQLVGLEALPIASLVSEDAGFDSICNSSSEGGSPFGASSIFNDASPYGGMFGLNSPFNLESTAPPQILVGGVFAGHLSVSPYVLDPIDPFAMLVLLGCPIVP